MSDKDHLLQVIKPQGFVATRFGFDNPLSTNTEQAMAKAGVAGDQPAVEVIEPTGGVRHA